jgi:hypothetical protein
MKLTKTSVTAVLALVLCALDSTTTAHAAQKPRWIPVKLEYVVPAGLKPGDEVTTVFVLTASAFVPRLNVELAPLNGLVWVEGEKTATFENVAEGQQREVRVKVKLAASRGEMAVTIQAVYDKSRFGDTVLVEYGEKR